MAANEIREDDIGTIIRATILDGSNIVDVSSATTQEFIFKPPRSTSFSRTTTFTTDGTDGRIEYTTISGDLFEPGNWKFQAHVILTTGDWRSDIGTFTVYKNL